MTGEQGPKAAPSTPPDDELDPRLDDPLVRAWFGEHLPELRRHVSGHRIPLLESRSRSHHWPGRPRRWIPAQIECDD